MDALRLAGYFYFWEQTRRAQDLKVLRKPSNIKGVTELDKIEQLV